MNPDPLTTLPGGALVWQGLQDYDAGQCTAAALLVAMAQGRLETAGVLSKGPPRWDEPELRLYRLLQREAGDAYSRYNSLRRELDSLLAALDRVRPRG